MKEKVFVVPVKARTDRDVKFPELSEKQLGKLVDLGFKFVHKDAFEFLLDYSKVSLMREESPDSFLSLVFLCDEEDICTECKLIDKFINLKIPFLAKTCYGIALTVYDGVSDYVEIFHDYQTVYLQMASSVTRDWWMCEWVPYERRYIKNDKLTFDFADCRSFLCKENKNFMKNFSSCEKEDESFEKTKRKMSK